MKAKRFFSAVMALTMVMGIASCGENAKSETKNADDRVRFAAPSGAISNGGDEAEAEAKEMTEAAAEDAEAGGEKKSFAAEEGISDEMALSDDGGAGEVLYDIEPGAEEPIAPEKNSPETELPAAGQLTAGVWNDNNNWSFFANLVNSEAISFPSFSIDPRDRMAITLKGEDGEVIANAKVKLISADGKALWSAVTDRKGRAYLFSYGTAADKVEVQFGGETQTFDVDMKNSSGDEQSSSKVTDNSAELVFSGRNGDKGTADAQIMFIVDTTGSMCDELLFLQCEFASLVREVGSEGIEYAVNFYRDEGDDYVTKCMDFTSDVDVLTSTLMSETSDGGGDIPEAVGRVMQESITDNSSWKQDTVKIAFMIFDAPPHDEDSDKVESAVRAAAEKGIKLIPIVSSNSERETELFGRAAAITTGGDYVFLTDDSGIGDSHLDPIVGDYEVEKLYDAIIRLINDYRS